MLSQGDKNKLKKILVRLESNKVLSEITWQQIEDGINGLSDQEKEKIVKSLVGEADGIKEFIQNKLKQSIDAQVELIVDGIITQGTVTTDYLFRILT